MRIFDSKGKDYYDGVMHSLFYGDDLLFIRERSVDYFDLNKVTYSSLKHSWESVNKDWPFGNAIRFSNSYFTISNKNKTGNVISTTHVNKRGLLIGFCGVVYPVIEESRTTKSAYDAEVIENSCEYFYSPREKDCPKTISLRSFARVEQIFENYKNPPQEFLDYWKKMMEDKKSPTFMVDASSGEITWNCHLSDVNFSKIFNSYEAAKKVYQFLANIPKDEMPIPQMDDITKAEIHGFNKYSFRKSSSKKI